MIHGHEAAAAAASIIQKEKKEKKARSNWGLDNSIQPEPIIIYTQSYEPGHLDRLPKRRRRRPVCIIDAAGRSLHNDRLDQPRLRFFPLLSRSSTSWCFIFPFARARHDDFGEHTIRRIARLALQGVLSRQTSRGVGAWLTERVSFCSLVCSPRISHSGHVRMRAEWLRSATRW